VGRLGLGLWLGLGLGLGLALGLQLGIGIGFSVTIAGRLYLRLGLTIASAFLVSAYVGRLRVCNSVIVYSWFTRNPVSLLRDVTCHMGSDNVTCCIRDTSERAPP